MVMMMKRCFSSGLKQVAGIIRAPEKLVFPTIPVHHSLIQEVEKRADQIVLVDGFTKEEINGTSFICNIGRMANKFKSLGIGHGDHVAIVGLNHKNYLAAKLGVTATGAVPVLFNPTFTKQEIIKLLTLSDCNYAIGHMCSASTLDDVNKEYPITLLPKLEDLEDWSKDESRICPEFSGSLDDTCMMLFSSGTTGLPKAVELTHENMNSQFASIEASGELDYLVESKGIESPCMVDFLPEFHGYGSLIAQFCPLHGYKRIFLPFFTPELFLQCLADYKVSCTTVVPPVMLMLNKLDIVPNYDLSALKLITNGAAPLDSATERGVKTRLEQCNPGMDLVINQGYGLTETSGASMVGRLASADKYGTVGKIVAGQEVKLVDAETGKNCGAFERGEIYLRGPQVMKGYYKNEAANIETFDGEWLKTGDIAYYDEDEDFFIVDRLKEFIKVKGYQVAPAELEGLLIAHEDIADAAVIGITHDRNGEAPKAYVVTRFRAKLTEQDVKDFIAEKVSDYKQLAEVEFVKSIPKLPSGKIQRKLLREKHLKDSLSK